MADRGDRKEKATKGSTQGPGVRRRQQAAQVAQVLLDRDDHVANGLALLGELGVLDERTQKRLWSLYQQGDQATRVFLQEQLARVVADGPVEPGPNPQAPKRTSSVDPLELEVLKQLSSPHVDAAEVAQHVRRFDPARLLGASKEPGGFMRFLSEAPLAVHRVQKRLLWAGVSILVFVVALLATAVFVPAIVPWVGLGGVVLLALFIGVLLVRTAGWIDRSAKQQGIDLAVYAQLPEDERRVLLVRRIGLRILDPHQKEAGPSGNRGSPKSPSVDPPEPVPAESETPVPQDATWPVQEGAMTQPEQEAVPVGPVSLEPEPERPPEMPPERSPEEPESHAAAPMPAAGRNGPSQEGPGRLARFVHGTRKAWRQAAQSETAHKVGSETKRVSQEAGKRAQQVGRSAHERFSELRERGEAGLEKRRQARTKRTPSKKRTVKKVPAKKTPAKRRGKKTAKKAVKKTSKRATKRGGKRVGKQAGNRGKKAAKKPTVRKGTAKKGAKRSRKRNTRQ